MSNAHTFTSRLFSQISRMNPKSNFSFLKIKDYVDLAIMQEKELEQDSRRLSSVIGSNVGVLIEQMRRDPREPLILPDYIKRQLKAI